MRGRAAPAIDVRKARMAELLANDHSVSDAGAIMGLTRGQTAHIWRSIKADLGGQAR